jgi:hypothetical protein
MAKGGFTGAVPPRETSPEEYSGVWDITEQYGEQKAGSWPFQADDCAPKSLRLDQASSAYLTRTPAAAGNRKTWTFNCWIKRLKQGGTSGTQDFILTSIPNLTHYFQIYFSSDLLYVQGIQSGQSSAWSLTTNQVFRDPSAWMMLTFVHDSTQATANERFKVYLNGQRITSFSTNTLSSYLPQNSDSAINSTQVQRIGTQSPYSSVHSDLMIAEATLIDGQTLEPTDFGFYDGQGIWQPKRFTGDYSSGPVYSNSAVISSGGSASSYPLHQGFNGDLSNRFEGDTTNAYVDIPYEATVSSGSVAVYVAVTSSQPVVVTLFNGSSQVATGSSGASGSQWHAPTTYAGPITKIRIARTGRAPEFNAVRVNGAILTDASVGRNSFHLDFSDGFNDRSGLGNNWTGNNLYTTTSTYGLTPSGSGLDQYLPTGFTRTNDENDVLVDNNTGVLINQGGTLYFVIVPTSTTVTLKHMVYDGSGTYNPTVSLNTAEAWNGTTIHPSSTSGSGSSSSPMISTYNNLSIGTEYFVRTGLTGSSNPAIVLYGTGFNFGVLGTNETDIFVDSPVNGNEASTGAGGERRGNYATLNPLISLTNITLSNGNLKYASAATYTSAFSSIGMTSGKWYFEGEVVAVGTDLTLGISADLNAATYVGGTATSYGYEGAYGTGKYNNASYVSTGYVGYGVGDIISCAFDADNGKVYFAKNGTWQESGDPANGTNPAFSNLTATPYFFGVSNGNGGSWTVNFGQRSFAYAPPTGYSPLATSFLPEPTIKRGDEAMDVKLYTGDGISGRNVRGFKMSPDLLWIKGRTTGGGQTIQNIWVDTVRGASTLLSSNEQFREDQLGVVWGDVSAFLSDGFTLKAGSGGHAHTNYNTATYAAFGWDAGEATTTIAAGGLNSSAYDQSQNWTSLLTSSAGTISNASNSFDGSTSTTSQLPGTSTGSYIQFGVTLNNVTKLEIYQRTNSDISGTGIQTYNNAPAAQWVELTLTSSTVSNIRLEKNTNDPGIYAIRVNNKVLVDSTATPPNVPSIATTVRARPETGFSILNYSASGTAGATVAHQLGKAPEFMIAKARNYVQNWFMFHKTVGAGGGFNFNQGTSAYTTDTGYWNGDEPDSNVVTLGNYHGFAGTHDFVLYAWTSVEGYSSFGSYEGSNTNVPFIYTGFSPRWILIANMDNASDFVVYDTARDANNQSSRVIAANSANSEGSYVSGYELDILSNGFRIRTSTSGAINQNAHTHVYAAFASHPFASNCRAR